MRVRVCVRVLWCVSDCLSEYVFVRVRFARLIACVVVCDTKASACVA